MAIGVCCAALQSSVQAASIFDLTSPSSNASLKTFLDHGITMKVYGSNSTGDTNNNTINTNPRGLCAWTRVGTTGFGRCGYGPTNPAGGISAFTLEFDKPIRLNAFDVSRFDAIAISSGTISFSVDNVNFVSTTFTALGTQSVAFQALANQPIYVTTSATIINSLGTGQFRINNLNVSEVPAPLSGLGLALAFNSIRQVRRFSRQLHPLHVRLPLVPIGR